MEITEYQEKAKRTMNHIHAPLMDEIHMILGMQTESAELSDAYKKHLAYGVPLDEANIKEELGDQMFYIINLCTIKGWDLRDILQTNIDKLASRYPEKFTNELAVNRDLIKEREILEK